MLENSVREMSEKTPLKQGSQRRRLEFEHWLDAPEIHKMMLSSIVSKKVGVLGGGQLGKMFAEAAHRLGLKVVVLDPAEDCPCHGLVDEHIVGDFKDPVQVLRLAEAKCAHFFFLHKRRSV